ncbi:STM4015 family protein [Yinghuangia seranimata]|uniref:STM4015 family protein n=1 Tax=Yinghuangia seranimata TaxID=408067 RepID=UPI00248AD8FC|nr:STM4015 family protein [Yinghuangia seranimata]MDI2131553.1 STM4015 family protein [Yinghuangia seranimata]
MTPVRHLTEFGGLPVVRFADDGPEAHDSTPAGSVAWKLGLDAWWRERGPARTPADAFREQFARFADTVDTAGVTALVIGVWGEPGESSGTAVDCLERYADRFPGLRAVFLGDVVPDECEISWLDQAAFTLVLQAFPLLEELGVRGGGGYRPVPLTHERLRWLTFESGNLSGRVVRCVAESAFPALEHLEIWCGDADYGADVEPGDVDRLVDTLGRGAPDLGSLGLRNCGFTDHVAAVLAAAPVTARLHTLDLSLGTLGDVGAEALLAGQPLTRLRRLDLHHHYLSRAMARRVLDTLVPAGVSVDVTQGRLRENAERFERYVAVAE